MASGGSIATAVMSRRPAPGSSSGPTATSSTGVAASRSAHSARRSVSCSAAPVPCQITILSAASGRSPQRRRLGRQLLDQRPAAFDRFALLLGQQRVPEGGAGVGPVAVDIAERADRQVVAQDQHRRLGQPLADHPGGAVAAAQMQHGNGHRDSSGSRL